MGMGMNHWECEGIELKKTFPLISTLEIGLRADEVFEQTSHRYTLPMLSAEHYRPLVSTNVWCYV